MGLAQMSGTIKTNYEKVREKVERAAERSGRNLSDIKIIAVSKTHPVETVLAAVEAGITVFGENRVDEALAKISVSSQDLEWHMIGQLQSRKAKDAAGKFKLIHSVDRESLAVKLNSEAEKKDIADIEILIQVDFTEQSGTRGAIAVINVDDSSQIPSFSEPFL